MAGKFVIQRSFSSGGKGVVQTCIIPMLEKRKYNPGILSNSTKTIEWASDTTRTEDQVYFQVWCPFSDICMTTVWIFW